MGYDSHKPIHVLESDVFARWLRAVVNREARALILIRVRRLSLGHFGDTRSLGRGVAELRVHAGPGYRIYFTRRDDEVVLLCGGTKSTQRRDIAAAHEVARALEEVE